MSGIIAVGIPSRFGLTGAKTAYKDENILLGEAQAINFVGSGVEASLSEGVLTVEIDGGGSSITVAQVIEDNAESVPSSAVLYALGQDFSTALGDKADIDSPTFTGTPTAPTPDSNDDSTTVATTEFVHDVVTAQVAGLWKDQGNFDASGGSWPTSANTIALDAIKAGYLWKVSVAGTLTGGVVLSVGDFIRALVDDAGNTAVDWAANEANIGYVPENETNKATDLTSPDNTKYPTTLAVSNALAGLSSEVVINTVNAGTVNIQANKSHEINAYGSFILNANSISSRRRIKIKNISTSTLVNVTLTTGVVTFFERDGSTVTTLSLERGTEIDIVNLGGTSNAIFRNNQVGPYGSFKILATDTQNIGLSFDLTTFGTNYTWTAPAANINFSNLDFIATADSNSRSGTRTRIMGGQSNTVSGTDNAILNSNSSTITAGSNNVILGSPVGDGFTVAASNLIGTSTLRSAILSSYGCSINGSLSDVVLLNAVNTTITVSGVTVLGGRVITAPLPNSVVQGGLNSIGAGTIRKVESKVYTTFDDTLRTLTENGTATESAATLVNAGAGSSAVNVGFAAMHRIRIMGGNGVGSPYRQVMAERVVWVRRRSSGNNFVIEKIDTPTADLSADGITLNLQIDLVGTNGTLLRIRAADTSGTHGTAGLIMAHIESHYMGV